jgi:hypothetical protein
MLCQDTEELYKLNYFQMNISERLINISSIPIIMNQKISRREFLGKTGIGLAGIVAGFTAGALSGCGRDERVDWEDQIDGYHVKYSKEQYFIRGEQIEKMEVYINHNPVRTITLTTLQQHGNLINSRSEAYECEEYLPEGSLMHGKYVLYDEGGSRFKGWYWIEQSGERHYSFDKDQDMIVQESLRLSKQATEAAAATFNHYKNIHDQASNQKIAERKAFVADSLQNAVFKYVK